MKISKGEYISEVTLEDLSLGEYHNFLKIKQLPCYEFENKVFKINSEYLKLLDNRQRVKNKKIEWNFNDKLFDYEQFIVKLAFLKRKFAIFAECGLGKTFVALEWIEQVKKVIPKDKKILIVSPLNIIEQTRQEQVKFYDRSDISNLHNIDFDDWLNDKKNRVGIINYDKFRNPIDFENKVDCFVGDETDILKSESGVIKTNLINACKGVNYKLCLTATPAPNDREEYANHALILDYIRNYQEFFHKYFFNKDSKWILKPHAKESFYRFLASFSIFIRDPKFYGFEDNLKNVPTPIIERVSIPLTQEQIKESKKLPGEPSGRFGFGFNVNIKGIQSRTKYSQISKGFIYENGDRRNVRKIESNKPMVILDIVNKYPKEKVIIWTNYDEEADILENIISPHRKTVKVTGKMKHELRQKAEIDFKTGNIEVLISNSNIFAKGMNFQVCTVMIFSGLDDSYVKFHHGIKRAARYGSIKQLKVFIPVTVYEEVFLTNVLSKKDRFIKDGEIQERLYKDNLIDELKDYADKENIMTVVKEKRKRIVKKGKNWTLIRNDNIEELENMEENSIDLSVFSPPFASLFTYSSDIADQGNSGSDAEFILNYKFFAERLLRVMKPGRKVCVHVSQLPILKSVTGYSGMKDFRGLIYEAMAEVGFWNTTEIVLTDSKEHEKIIVPFNGEIVIKKSQQMASIIKHAPGLAIHLFESNSLKCMPCFNDYILIFTKPGDPEVPVTPVLNKDMTRDDWVKFASGIWIVSEEVCDIRESDVIKRKRTGRTKEDVKHICPLQLEVYRRLYKLYSNPGEEVLEPFNGIGSGGVVAIELNRKYKGIELKKEYFLSSVSNLELASKQGFKKFTKK